MQNIALETIDSLRLPQLQALFAEVIGETTRSPNKKYLIRRIRETIEAQAAASSAEEQAKITTEEPAATEEPVAAEDAAPAANAEVAAARADLAEDAAGSDQDAPTGEGRDATADTADLTGAESAATDEDQDAAADLADTADSAAGEKRLSKMTVAELQARYLEVVGRPTGSSHKRYLIWKIREAQKGRIKTGPTNRRDPGEPAPDFMVLPLRMEAELVQRLDDARERIGLKSRMDLFRKAIAAYLTSAGETELAADIAPAA